jgi:hypothetical protein
MPAVVFIIGGRPGNQACFLCVCLAFFHYEDEWTPAISRLCTLYKYKANHSRNTNHLSQEYISQFYGIQMGKVMQFWPTVYCQNSRDWTAPHTRVVLASLEMNMRFASCANTTLKECNGLIALLQDLSIERPFNGTQYNPEVSGMLNHLPLQVALDRIQQNMEPDGMRGLQGPLRDILQLLQSNVDWDQADLASL